MIYKAVILFLQNKRAFYHQKNIGVTICADCYVKSSRCHIALPITKDTHTRMTSCAKKGQICFRRLRNRRTKSQSIPNLLATHPLPPNPLPRPQSLYGLTEKEKKKLSRFEIIVGLPSQSSFWTPPKKRKKSEYKNARANQVMPISVWTLIVKRVFFFHLCTRTQCVSLTLA